MIVGAEEEIDPETLLAGVGASTAEGVILSSAVWSQKKLPFPMPFLAPAHRSGSNAGFFGAVRSCSSSLRTANARVPFPMI